MSDIYIKQASWLPHMSVAVPAVATSHLQIVFCMVTPVRCPVLDIACADQHTNIGLRVRTASGLELKHKAAVF